MIQIGSGLDKGAAGLGHLGAVHGDKAMAVDSRWFAQTGTVQHGRPEQTVKIDDVLADKVIELGVGSLCPVVVEAEAFAVAVVLEARHVPDRGIQPDIKILAGVTGDLETKIGRFPGNVPGLQVFDPFLQFVGDLLLQSAGTGPLAQQRLEFGQVEEQLGGVLLYRGGTTDGRVGLDQLCRGVGRTADFTVVAILVFRLALRAGALDETVGQEHAFLRVVKLGDGLLDDVACVFVSLEDHL